MIFVLEPPPQYNIPYQGQVIEYILPLAQARRFCKRHGVWADACAWKAKGVCYIVIPKDGPVKDLNAYRRHEKAHCLGWIH